MTDQKDLYKELVIQKCEGIIERATMLKELLETHGNDEIAPGVGRMTAISLRLDGIVREVGEIRTLQTLRNQ